MGRMNISGLLFEDTVRSALCEDLGRAGDLTTDAIVSSSEQATGKIIVRRCGRIAGGEVALRAFEILDDAVAGEIQVNDGEDAAAGAALLEIRGPARAVLSAERTALNFFGHLCGIATLTRTYVDAVAATDAKVVCTRKTTPGLRALEKYAVRCGGGANHRFGLDDAVLIKDNHLAIAGDVRTAVDRARAAVGHTVKIELEVDTLEQLEDGLAAEVDAVLMDNMDVETLSEAVRTVGGRCTTEASGGINIETAAAISATGVDLLSVGALTHSAPWLDLSLEVEND